MNIKFFWKIWAKAMGSKISDNQFESDVAAIIRTIFWVVNLVTCGFIIANAIRHW
jgi:hypothetical protein